MREEKESRDSFRGQIGENVRQSRTEIEENILRLLYEWWVQGRRLNRDAVCGQLRMNRRKLAWYITSMTEHGYLENSSCGGDLVLTDFGKEQGADCHRRHQSITHFMQITCGLDEERAEENACRMEHVLSADAIEGMYHFIRQGELYDSIIRNVDFCSRYPAGEYVFCMAIYRLDRRYPRVLAEENACFEETVHLAVRENTSVLYLKLLPESVPAAEAFSFLWYKREDGWQKAEQTERGFCVPAEILTLTSNGRSSFTEGEGMIAFTKDDTFPDEAACRELNIYLW